jgi:hypothetical protein
MRTRGIAGKSAQSVDKLLPTAVKHSNGVHALAPCGRRKQFRVPLEHARDVQQNFEMTVDYCGFALDPDHLEAKLNSARCP